LVNTYFWKGRPNFRACTIGGKKETCRKGIQISMQEEKKSGIHKDNPNHDRVRVFDNIVTTRSQ